MITAIRHLLLWNWQAGVESSTMSEERLSSKAILGVNRIKECGLRICMSEGESSVLPLRCKLHKKCTLRWGRVIFVTNWGVLKFFVFLVLLPTTALMFHNFSLYKGHFSRILLRYDWKLDLRRVSHMSCAARSRKFRHASWASHHASLVIQWFDMFIFWSLKYP